MSRPIPKPDLDVHESAARWYARLTSDIATSADYSAFAAWIEQAPEHAEAYAEVCALSGRFESLRSDPEILDLRAETYLLEERVRRPFLKRFGAANLFTGLVAAAAAAIALFYVQTTPLETREWMTARGETLAITLSDGTHIILGSDSRLEMHFWRNRRDLELDRGQAFFDVAHDASRPFVVEANERTVTALGTAFDVRSYHSETTVTLVRGRVAIARDGEGNEAILAPGQQFHVALGVISVRDVNAAAETAWRVGALEFDGATLEDAVAVFNRSARNAIVLSDPNLAGLRVSGVFNANDPEGFAEALAPVYDLIAEKQSSGDIVLRARNRGRAVSQ